MDIHPDAIQSLINSDHGSPADLLGAHPTDGNAISYRTFRPTAEALVLIVEETGERHPMNRLHPAGFFELTLEGEQLRFHYEAQTFDGRTETFYDPYIFPRQLTAYDLHLLGEGRYLYSYEKFGSHLLEVDGVVGTSFAVWAPNAYRVSVIGDFNDWDSRTHPMILHGVSGVWELFIPGVVAGMTYKFDIRSRFMGFRAEKADPYAFQTELRPRTASVVTDMSSYSWQDTAWMEQRASRSPLDQAMAIYEVHLGSWRRKNGYEWLSYRELADALVSYVSDMGFTHIELLPVAEHPFDGSWGYQVTGYYAPTSRFGTPDDFKYFVDQCHQHNIGVILDWVPAHFPKDGFALSFFDGTHLYEHADVRKGEHPDWGTYIFNYGRNEVRNFLISNALFWMKEYHIDGLRVDAVASMLYLDFSRKAGEWLPNEYGGNENIEAIQFLREFNSVVHSEAAGAMTIAEESTAWPMVSRPTYIGGLGFTFKWNMGWMHDVLKYMQKNPVFRRYHHNQVTFSLMYAFSENFVLSISHDEVVHGKGSMIGKMSGDWWQKFASLRLVWGYQYTHPGKKLNFMGAEFGQWAEWSEERSLDWHLLDLPTHASLQQWVRDLNAFYQSQPCLYEQDFDYHGFQWIEPNDSDQSVFTYMRFAKDTDDFIVVACNFTPVPRYNYRVGVPKWGFYKEVLNSDGEVYGGGNLGNYGGLHTDAVPTHQQTQSLSLTVPPLGIVVLKWEKPKVNDKSK
ncbi:MAG: 1,4-alpha-glucan branching protein GlgB [Anaerolineales bacterium]|nr:1,4-alpha-glucan branching protein GlgB [Anaerolineales bacterium]